MNLTTSFLMIAISCYCINLTYSANREDDGSGSSTPKKGLMKRIFDFEKNKEVEKTRGDERKKGRMGSSSSAQGTTNKGKEVQDQPGGTEMIHKSGRIISRNKPKLYFTREQLVTLLRLTFLIDDDDRQNLRSRWSLIYSGWKTIHGDLSSKNKLKSKAHNMLKKILTDFKQEEGGIEWTDDLNMNLLRIYFQTEYGDRSSHDRRISDMWQRIYPGYRIPEPGYLSKRAERMITSVKQEKFNLDDPPNEAMQITPRLNVAWKPEHNELFRNLWYSHDSDRDGPKKKYIYDNAKKIYKGLDAFTVQQVYEHARYLKDKPQRQQVPIDSMINPRMEQGSSSHHPGGTESSMRNPELSQDHLDLELRLGSHDFQQHPERESHDSDNN